MILSKKKVHFQRRGHNKIFVVHVIDMDYERVIQDALEVRGYEGVILLDSEDGGAWSGDVTEIEVASMNHGNESAIFASEDPSAVERVCEALRVLNGRDEIKVRRHFRP